ncbi:MAG TPA: c-type cytochrome [Bryobacteraceae bacterium]|nr:c-type cytochrome [Bryobacteraceae bacterium]
MWKLVLCGLLAQAAMWAAPSGEALFRTNCAPCHGPRGGGGRGPNLAMRRLPLAPDDAAISTIITNGIPGTQMPATRMTAAENAALVAYVRSLGQTQAEHVPGDAANGRRLFVQKGNCIRCHTVGATGGRMGPDLTDIGARRGPAYLRESIVNPQAEIPDNFASYRKLIYTPDNFLLVRAVTQDGKPISGVRVDEDTFTIQIRDFSDHIYSFRKADLRELHEDWGKSPMPSFQGVFSESELQDLVAYLASLQGEQ